MIRTPNRQNEARPRGGAVTIGVDPGQRVDPSAIAVVEAVSRVRPGPSAMLEYVHEVRRLERLPLGTSYVDVAQRVQQMATGVIRRTGLMPQLFIDATGVGTPLVDILIKANVQARLVAVYFSYGDRRVLQHDNATRRPFISLGKAWLVGRLQALLQGRLIRLPDTAEADTIVEELLNYELRVTEDANDRYGAFRVGTHDDLVTALGLATQDDGPLGFAPAVGAPRPALPKAVLG